MKCVSKASISKNVKAIEKQMRGKKGEKKKHQSHWLQLQPSFSSHIFNLMLIHFLCQYFLLCVITLRQQ